MYAKLFASLYQGTLRGNSHGILVFTNMMAHADIEGHVDMHPRAIAEEVGLTLEQVQAAIAGLEAEDDESRSPEENGKRIIRLDEHRAWGWRIVNHAKYRSIRNEEDRREQNRRSQAAWRLKQKELSGSADSKQSKPASAEVSRGNPIQKQKQKQKQEEETTQPAAASGGAPPGPPMSPSATLQETSSGQVAQKRATRPAQTAEVWAAYSSAYEERYGIAPVRNAKVNGMLAQFLSRLGSDEAVGVARFYITSRNGLYVSAKHCVDLMLRDAEKLHTEWRTGNTGYQRDAQEQDRLASTGAMWERVGKRLAEKGIT